MAFTADDIEVGRRRYICIHVYQPTSTVHVPSTYGRTKLRDLGFTCKHRTLFLHECILSLHTILHMRWVWPKCMTCAPRRRFTAAGLARARTARSTSTPTSPRSSRPTVGASHLSFAPHPALMQGQGKPAVATT
jgi:hypothetical protein